MRLQGWRCRRLRGRYLYLDDADSAAREEFQREIVELKQYGIGAVVSLTEDPLAAVHFEKADIRYLHLPIPDMTAPTASQIDQFIDFARSNVEEGRAIALHCFAGAGRTGTMIACYLVSKGYTAGNAISAVRKLRPGAIETRWQENAVFEYAAQNDS